MNTRPIFDEDDQYTNNNVTPYLFFFSIRKQNDNILLSLEHLPTATLLDYVIAQYLRYWNYVPSDSSIQQLYTTILSTYLYSNVWNWVYSDAVLYYDRLMILFTIYFHLIINSPLYALNVIQNNGKLKSHYYSIMFIDKNRFTQKPTFVRIIIASSYNNRIVMCVYNYIYRILLRPLRRLYRGQTRDTLY